MGITSGEKKLPYPKSVAFIISNEFCERFCFYGMRAILVLYLTRKLNYDADTATAMFHIFTGLAFFFPIMGAIVSDSWLGRFKTILYMSCVYMVGNSVIALGAIPSLNLPANTFTLLGLFLIAFGTGGIKPCVTAFGGDQFKLPEQAVQLAFYFSLFYMAINAGSLFSTIVTPILREDVQCFGEDSCFSLAFGVPSVLMVISIVIFISGKPFYKITKPSGNMLVDVSKCIWNAVWTRSAERRNESAPKSHWLDYAEAKHGAKLVDDVKALLKILLLYLPLPLFWALQDQQGSRWTFQAIRLDGVIGGFTIKPDQMHVINPVLIILFIPLWDIFVYPFFAYLGIRRSLQKLTVGMIFAGLAFFTSGVLELQLESMDPVLPGPSECQLRIFNGLDGPITFQTNVSNVFKVDAIEVLERKHIEVNKLKTLDYVASSKDGKTMTGKFNLTAGKSVSYFVTRGADNASRLVEYEESPGRPFQAIPVVRLLTSTYKHEVMVFRAISGNVDKSVSSNDTGLNRIVAGTYEVRVRDQVVQEVHIRQGGAYTLVILEQASGEFLSQLFTVVEPNQMHILWQLPQYILLTAGEIMFSVTGLEFSFTESPDTMKSVIQACWQLTVTFGNLFVVLIAQLAFFEAQSSEFFFFTALMFVDVLLFSLLAMRYRYRNMDKDAESTSLDQRPAAMGLDNSAFSGDK